MWWLITASTSAVVLLSIVLSIPIAFDVGGRDAGLAYSLSLFLFYLFYSIIKLLTPEKSRVRWFLKSLVGLSQWIVIPTLLIWSLNRFSVDADGAEVVSRTFSQMASTNHKTWKEWFFGQDGFVETVALGAWDNTLSYASPVFQLVEGFCSLLVIQAAGQITRWLVNRGRSDTWLILLLVLSASIISSSVYFMWRVISFPQISNMDATLIGVAMTSVTFLCAFGIASGRGNPVESSLLFAYAVLCIYQIFTDYQPSPEAAAAQPEFPPLPPIIMASYSTLLHMLGSLPTAVSSSFQFLYAAFQTITPSVIISLTYRIIVFYCATRIIPAVRELGASALMDEPSLEDSEGANRLIGFLSWFSPSLLIAVYTSLLLQHFSVSSGDDVGWTLRAGDAGGSTWRWVNIGATMALYVLELYLGGDGDGGEHWKAD
ncbi:ICE2-domain-containing protein [Staphylotrichum tortipilum]|uniref:ICE2-domain-containing protein n=1 Tax=Staphylotrichum tortipilum TaxID=2831512 RepID=A0AAN6MCS7_9PEZI|nr:ICE2-domain-containing protein [Staphylotrichum longicolle]